MKSGKEKEGRFIRPVVIAGVLAIFAISWHLGWQQLEGIAWIKSKHRFEFPNGGSFHLFEVTATDTIYLDSSRGSRKHAKGVPITNGYQDGGWMDFYVDHVGETYVGRRLRLKTEGLVLVVGMTDHLGEAILPTSCRWGFWGDFAEIRYQASGAAWQPAESSVTALDYGVEIGDGLGGWIPLFGPYTTEEENWKTILTAPVFPRDRAELELRIERRDSPPLEVSIPNPAFGSPVETWTADAQPYRQPLGMGEIRLDGFEWRWPRSGGGPQLHPKLSVHPVDGRGPEEFRARIDWISDEVGNDALTEDFVVVAGVDHVRLRGNVRPNYGKYRWREGEVDFFADGVWDDGKEEVSLVLRPEAKSAGLASIILLKKGPVPKQLNTRIDWDVEAPKTWVGVPEKPVEFGGVLFCDDETVSARGASLGSGGGDGKTVIFRYLFGIDGTPDHGQRLRFGRVREDLSETFEFTIPASEIPPVPQRRP